MKFLNNINRNGVLSIITALLLIVAGIIMYLRSGNHINSTIWILLSPLALSSHPIFLRTCAELNMDSSSYLRKRQILNFFRFSIFIVGIGLFIIQVLIDVNK